MGWIKRARFLNQLFRRSLVAAGPLFFGFLDELGDERLRLELGLGVRRDFLRLGVGHVGGKDCLAQLDGAIEVASLDRRACSAEGVSSGGAYAGQKTIHIDRR